MVTGSPGRTLAKRLLALEAGAAPDRDVLAASAVRVCEKLYQEIGQFIGPEGFNALLARALHLARSEFPFLKAVQVGGDSGGNRLSGLTEVVIGRETPEATDGIAAVLGGFIDLLGTFVGSDLTLRMVHRRWPEVPTWPATGKEGKPDG